MSLHKIPYILPFDYQDSIAVNFFQHIRSSLVPEFVRPMVTHPTGAISMVLTSAGFLAAMITIPFGVYKAIDYITPALTESEKNTVKKLAIPGTLLFFGGVAFSYFVFLPIAYNFLYSWGSWMGVQTKITLSNLTSFTSSMMIVMGLSWELPLVMVGVSKTGLAEPSVFEQYWRHFVVAILAISAFLTPADVFTMGMFALPLIGLYVAGLFVSKNLYGGDT